LSYRFKTYIAAVSLLLLSLLCYGSPSRAEPTANPYSELGSKLHLPISEWTDPAVPRKGIIIAVHALLLSGASYDNFARHLTSLGYTVYAPDIRGFGRWRNEFSKIGSGDHTDYRAGKKDLERIISQLRTDNPNTPMVLMGESMGADYTLWLLSETPAKMIDAAIVSAPGFKFLFHPSRHVPVDIFFACFHPTKQINFDHYLERYLSQNGEVTQTWRSNPSISRTFSATELIHASNMFRAAFKNVRRIPPDFPILILAGANDQVFSTAAIPKRAKKFGSQNLSINIFPDKGHLLLEAQHVDPDTQKLIDNFLAEQIDRRGSILKATSK
jgi:alpha-beta hydrolase superfamily lysophospholipase